MKAPVTSENVKINSSSKRRLEAVVHDSDGGPPTKRAKDEGHKKTSHSREDSGNEVTGSSKARTRGLSQTHPVNIQNGICAAERLSCSLDMTHSINFILLGEIQDPKSFTPYSSLAPPNS